MIFLLLGNVIKLQSYIFLINQVRMRFFSSKKLRCFIILRITRSLKSIKQSNKRRPNKGSQLRVQTKCLLIRLAGLMPFTGPDVRPCVFVSCPLLPSSPRPLRPFLAYVSAGETDRDWTADHR